MRWPVISPWEIATYPFATIKLLTSEISVYILQYFYHFSLSRNVVIINVYLYFTILSYYVVLIYNDDILSSLNHTNFK